MSPNADGQKETASQAEPDREGSVQSQVPLESETFGEIVLSGEVEGPETRLLRYARGLIAAPHGWTKSYHARSRSGEPVAFDNPDATCFCTIGAMKRAASDLKLDSFYQTARDRLAENVMRWSIKNKRRYPGVAVFNDTRRDVAPVLEMFDAAIAAQVAA